MPMQPRPMAETCRPWLPSLRVPNVMDAVLPNACCGRAWPQSTSTSVAAPTGRKAEKRGGSADGEQFLVESTDLAGTIDQMDFQNPVPPAPRRVHAFEQIVVARHDVLQHPVAGNAFVREFAHQVAGDGAAEGPAGFGGEGA